MPTEFNIDFTNVNDPVIEFEAPIEGAVNGQLKSYLHTLSQVDIDNKYIDASYLHFVLDKTAVQVWLESSICKLAYDVDYTIANDRINWDARDPDNLIKLGRKLKIYY